MNREIKRVKIGDLIEPKRPLTPWTAEESKEMFVKSQAHDHRKVTQKCTQCSLEFSVLTWRDGKPEELAEFFPHCPECGTKGSLALIRVDHEMGEIYRAFEASE
jgi:peptide subunit release factor 1 (eRF1)